MCVIILLCLLIVGCTADKKKTDSSVKKEHETVKKKSEKQDNIPYLTMYFDKKAVSLYQQLNVLLDDGWEASKMHEEKLPEDIEVDDQVNLHMKKNGKKVLISVANDTDEKIPFSKAVIASISLDFNEADNVSLVNGLKKNSSMKETIAVFGEPSKVTTDNKDTVNFLYLSADSFSLFDMMDFSYKNDKLVAVTFDRDMGKKKREKKDSFIFEQVNGYEAPVSALDLLAEKPELNFDDPCIIEGIEFNKKMSVKMFLDKGWSIKDVSEDSDKGTAVKLVKGGNTIDFYSKNTYQAGEKLDPTITVESLNIKGSLHVKDKTFSFGEASNMKDITRMYGMPETLFYRDRQIGLYYHKKQGNITFTADKNQKIMELGIAFPKKGL